MSADDGRTVEIREPRTPVARWRPDDRLARSVGADRYADEIARASARAVEGIYVQAARLAEMGLSLELVDFGIVDEALVGDRTEVVVSATFRILGPGHPTT